jgi:hypothetical protein
MLQDAEPAARVIGAAVQQREEAHGARIVEDSVRPVNAPAVCGEDAPQAA